MTQLEHKAYGSMGSEFILHHCTLRPRRLLVSLVITTILAVVFKLYETDVTVLWLLSLLLAVLLVFRLFNKVSKEVLLVLPSLGVQVKTQYWFGHQETQFFDKSRVKGIVINEAITMQSVLCYLAVLLRSSPAGKVEQVYPLFTRSWPCLKDLVYVYQAVENMCNNQPQSHSKPETRSSKVDAGETGLIPTSTSTPPVKVDQHSASTKRRTRSSKS